MDLITTQLAVVAEQDPLAECLQMVVIGQESVELA
jgi:hypothetical protein